MLPNSDMLAYHNRALLPMGLPDRDRSMLLADPHRSYLLLLLLLLMLEPGRTTMAGVVVVVVVVVGRLRLRKW